jgi:hypothetical protein
VVGWVVLEDVWSGRVHSAVGNARRVLGLRNVRSENAPSLRYLAIIEVY